MALKHLIAAGVATAALVTGAAVVPAQAVTPLPTVSLASVPSVVQLPKAGATGEFTFSVRITGGGSDVFQVEGASITQPHNAPMDYYSAGGTSVTFQTQGALPAGSGTLAGNEKLTVAVTDLTTGQVLNPVTKKIRLVAHDTVLSEIGATNYIFHRGGKLTVTAVGSANVIGAKASLWFAKPGSKKYHKIGSAKVGHLIDYYNGRYAYVKIKTTKLVSGGHLYITVTGTSTVAKSTSKVVKFRVKHGTASFS